MCLCCHKITTCYNTSCSYCIKKNDYTRKNQLCFFEFNNQNCPICCTFTGEQYEQYRDSDNTCIRSLHDMLSAPTNKTTGILVKHNPSERCVDCIFCGGVVAGLAFTECMFTWILYHFCMPFIGAYNHCENPCNDCCSSCKASCVSCFKNLSLLCQEAPQLVQVAPEPPPVQEAPPPSYAIAILIGNLPPPNYSVSEFE